MTALPILAEHARYKVWIRPNGEMPFLYGGHVVKAHVGRFTEDTPEHQGVVVLSMDDKPLGFGVTARSTPDARRLDPTGIVCFRQADCGEPRPCPPSFPSFLHFYHPWLAARCCGCVPPCRVVSCRGRPRADFICF